MSEFKVGDYVACKINRYSITSIDRPCQVKEIEENMLNVYCLGDGGCYNVPKSEFYLLDGFIPFKYNEKLTYEDKLYYFREYNYRGGVIEDELKRYTIPYSELYKLHRVGGMFI